MHLDRIIVPQVYQPLWPVQLTPCRCPRASRASETTLPNEEKGLPILWHDHTATILANDAGTTQVPISSSVLLAATKKAKVWNCQRGVAVGRAT
jgi:hypothetical protein